MSQLRLEFSFPHPPALVWRALTESHILALWLVENDLVPRPGQRFRLRAMELAGIDELIDGAIVDLAPGERLAMIWRTDEAHLGMTWQLRPVPDGTVLEVTQTGLLGVAGQQRRDTLQRTYEHVFGQRLRDVLGALDGPPPAAPEPAVALAAPAAPAPPAATGADRRGRAGVLLGGGRSLVSNATLAVVLAAVVAGFLTWLSKPGASTTDPGRWDNPATGNQVGSESTGPLRTSVGSPHNATTPDRTAAGAPRGSAAQPSAAPTSAGPVDPPSAPPSPPAVAAPLTASYVTLVDESAYVVTVTNPGGVPSADWVMTVQAPALDVVSATGVTWTRKGNTVTFTPDATTDVVPAHGQVRFRVVVAKKPKPLKACTINGRAC
ncbi:SRPBCC domain-containing protein [Luedemannella helvata]|uniref:CBM2 domain-containing protein n=1 Tax=Luedemannella helvata TaxID=349315 RepID=A0ABN2JWJ7_9ACTN